MGTLEKFLKSLIALNVFLQLSVGLFSVTLSLFNMHFKHLFLIGTACFNFLQGPLLLSLQVLDLGLDVGGELVHFLSVTLLILLKMLFQHCYVFLQTVNLCLQYLLVITRGVSMSLNLVFQLFLCVLQLRYLPMQISNLLVSLILSLVVTLSFSL